MRVFQSSVRCGASKGLFGPREKPSHTVTEGDHASEMTSRETDQILACQRNTELVHLATLAQAAKTRSVGEPEASWP
jgi:hypothetical protein